MLNTYYIYPYNINKILDDIHSNGHYNYKTFMKFLYNKSIKWTNMNNDVLNYINKCKYCSYLNNNSKHSLYFIIEKLFHITGLFSLKNDNKFHMIFNLFLLSYGMISGFFVNSYKKISILLIWLLYYIIIIILYITLVFRFNNKRLLFDQKYFNNNNIKNLDSKDKSILWFVIIYFFFYICFVYKLIKNLLDFLLIYSA